MADLIKGLGGDKGFGDLAISGADDVSSSSIDITSIFGASGINFYGIYYTRLYINNNGSITFGDSLDTYTTYPLGSINTPIIAPFMADVDTRGIPTGATTGGNSTGSNSVYKHLDTVNKIFTATWDDVGYYNAQTDKLNAFQLRLYNRENGDFDLEFRYEAINWTTGSASGGTGGLGGNSSIAGYASTTRGAYYQLPGSQTPSMLDLDSIEGNTGEIGIWRFSFTNGFAENKAPADIILSQDNVDENLVGALIGTLSATDREMGETHTFTLLEGGAFFEIAGTELRLKPGVSLDHEAADSHDLKIRVEDSALNRHEQTITIFVNDVYEAPPNSAPRFTGPSDLSVKENQTLVATLTARDPDGDALRYSIAGGDDAALFSINSRTGALSFINPPDFESPHSADGSNLYDVRVRVSDGVESTSKPFTITVTDVNEPPVFTGASALNIRENQTLIATLAANDPDADALTFQIAGGDDAALFTVDADTGALSFIGAPDFETPSSADGTNVYEVGIRASDGAESASRLFTVTVTDTAEISRFFNITTGMHFYTADSAERDRLIATNADYVFEGETFSTAATDADGVSVYRFFNTLTGGHFYTADADEAASVHADLPQLSYEGEAFMAYDSAGSDRQAVHRFYNVETQAHFYTSDETERVEVLATLPQYSYEGVAFYVDFA